MGVRDRLEGKGRRTATVPVPVEDPAEHEKALEAAETFLAAARARDAREDAQTPSQAVLDAQAVCDGALARLEACFERVEFGSMEPAAFEALLAEHTDVEGELDVDTFRPILIAACATDSELQDAAWWAEQLGTPKWAHGEREALYVACWRLNFSPPRGRLGKG